MNERSPLTSRVDELANAIVAAMPLTYSISNGIALGLVFFPVMMAAKGRWRDVHPIAWVLMLASAGYFLFLTE